MEEKTGKISSIGIVIRVSVYLILGIILYSFIVKQKNSIISERTGEITGIYAEWKSKGYPVNALKVDKTDFNITDITTAEVKNPTVLQAKTTEFLQKKLKTGLRVYAFASGKEIPGTVSFVSPQLEVTSGLYTIRFKLKDPLPGNVDRVKVRIITQTFYNMLTVPVESIATENRHDYIWKIENGKAVKTKIKKGITDGFSYTIESGLKKGDLVITDGFKKIKENDKVRIFECKNCT